MIGKKLAHYEITSKIGKGGMGEVYRAKDTKLGRDVAIKVLPEEFAFDPNRVARLQREAKLLAALNHPNIAAIYGLEDSDGTHFLVMELIEGDTLSDRIKKGPIPVEEALKLAIQITEALEAAHEKGVIHRDLKPANIKVTPEGKVKVLDFGLAKAFAGDETDVNLTDSPTLSDVATRQGIILGTAAYMSPEQARGKSVDKRADIWAFGVVLYEMLAGKALFAGEDITSTLARVLEREPDFSTLPENLHPRIRFLLERCLKKEVRDRYGTIGDARVDIQEVLADPNGLFALPDTSLKTHEGNRTSLFRVAVTVIMTAAIVGAMVWKLRTPSPPEIVSFRYELPAGQKLTYSLFMPLVAVSPDGKRFVYNTTDGLYSRSMDEMDARLIAGTANQNIGDFFFSPDGKWLAYHAEGKLKKIAVGGGIPQVLCNIPNFVEGSWYDPDTIVFSTNTSSGNNISGEILKISTDGGDPQLLLEGDGLAVYPQMLPGGRSVLYTKVQMGGTPITSQVMVRSFESEESKPLIAGYVARYLRTGHLVYTVGNDIMSVGGHILYAVSFDPETLEATGDPVPLVENIRGPFGIHYAVSNSGTLVYLTATTGSVLTDDRDLVWVDREGNEERLGPDPDQYDGVRISPDGAKVALTVANINTADVWIWDVNRRNMSRLTRSEAFDQYPVWAPDGGKILFSSDRETNRLSGIFWKASDGAGETEKFYSLKGKSLFPMCWPEKGNFLIVGETESNPLNANIGILSTEEDGALEPLLHGKYDEIGPRISPDGKWMAYQSDESGRYEIYMCPFPEVTGRRYKVSTEGGISPLWAPDGKKLYYRSGDATMEVELETAPTLNPLTPRILFKGAYYTRDIDEYEAVVTPWDISRPDGRRFLMLKPLDQSVAESPESPTDEETPQRIEVVVNWFEELKVRVPVE